MAIFHWAQTIACHGPDQKRLRQGAIPRRWRIASMRWRCRWQLNTTLTPVVNRSHRLHITPRMSINVSPRPPCRPGVVTILGAHLWSDGTFQRRRQPGRSISCPASTLLALLQTPNIRCILFPGSGATRRGLGGRASARCIRLFSNSLEPRPQALGRSVPFGCILACRLSC